MEYYCIFSCSFLAFFFSVLRHMLCVLCWAKVSKSAQVPGQKNLSFTSFHFIHSLKSNLHNLTWWLRLFPQPVRRTDIGVPRMWGWVIIVRPRIRRHRISLPHASSFAYICSSPSQSMFIPHYPALFVYPPVKSIFFEYNSVGKSAETEGIDVDGFWHLHRLAPVTFPTPNATPKKRERQLSWLWSAF